jgi:phosphoglycerate kinase
MANNIIKFMGNNIGKSLHEENSDKIIKKFYYFQKKQTVK